MKPTNTTVNANFGSPRTIKELLQIMLDNQDLFDSGLCFWVSDLYYEDKITDREALELSTYVKNNKPWYIFSSCGYWWKRGDINPRIKWIKRHIKKN